MTKHRAAARATPDAAEIPPGPNAGRIWRDPLRTFRDAVSGRTVRRLTSYRGHSHHLAGPAACWLGEGQCVVVSDREGWSNLFVYDFAAQTLRQLTDLRGSERPGDVRATPAAHLSFRYGGDCFEMELAGLRIRTVAPAAASRRVSAVAPARWHVGVTLRDDGAQALWIAGSPERAGSARKARMSDGEPRVAALIEGRDGRLFVPASPILRPGEAEAIFVAEADGYAQIHSVELGRIAELPRLAEVLR